MQSTDKTTIKSKVMHVYVSTTVLANDIQILRFISYRDSETELMPIPQERLGLHARLEIPGEDLKN